MLGRAAEEENGSFAQCCRSGQEFLRVDINCLDSAAVTDNLEDAQGEEPDGGTKQGIIKGCLRTGQVHRLNGPGLTEVGDVG